MTATTTTDGGDNGRRPHPVPADIPRLVEEAGDVGERVTLENKAEEAAVPAAAGRAAYRVVQEGLTNARKHAAGQPVRVVLDGTPGSELVVDIRNPLPHAPSSAPPQPARGHRADHLRRR